MAAKPSSHHRSSKARGSHWYWDISLCTGVDGSGGVGNNFGVDGCFGVDGTDGVGSGGDVGGDCGDSDNAGSFGGS